MILYALIHLCHKTFHLFPAAPEITISGPINFSTGLQPSRFRFAIAPQQLFLLPQNHNSFNDFDFLNLYSLATPTLNYYRVFTWNKAGPWKCPLSVLRERDRVWVVENFLLLPSSPFGQRVGGWLTKSSFALKLTRKSHLPCTDFD